MVALASFLPGAAARAQDLVPGVYAPAPVGLNVVTLAAILNDGDFAFDASLPVEKAHATVGATVLGIGRTLNIAGRFANVGLAVPYLRGHVEGLLLGQPQKVFRSGLGDPVVRLAVDLFGAPAMTFRQFAAYRPTTILGLSVTVGVPLGQYDSSRYINVGTHRWCVRPEVGISRRSGRWRFEGDVGASFFARNTNFLRGGTLRQAPIVSVQGHLIYTIRPGLWVAGDANFWDGGRLTIRGVKAIDQQQNSRVGVTLAVPVGRQQVRIAYSFGLHTTIGGDFRSIGVSYSYAWAGHP